MVGAFAENEAREQVADRDENNDGDRYLPFVLGEEGQRVVAIANGEIAYREIADGAGQGDRGSVAPQRDFEDTCGKNKKFEGRWRRK